MHLHNSRRVIEFRALARTRTLLVLQKSPAWQKYALFPRVTFIRTTPARGGYRRLPRDGGARVKIHAESRKC